MEVIALASDPFSTRTRKKSRTAFHLYFEAGELMLRSVTCSARSLSPHTDEHPKRTVAGYGCVDCVSSADDIELLSTKVRMAKRLDHLTLAERKGHGKPGSVAEFQAQVSGRSYIVVPPDCHWIESLLNEEFMQLVQQPLSQDLATLNHGFGCVPEKNAALQRICETRLKSVVVRPPSTSDQDRQRQPLE